MKKEKDELIGSKLRAVLEKCGPKARKRAAMLYRKICQKDSKLMIKNLHVHLHFENNREDVGNMFFDNHGPLKIE